MQNLSKEKIEKLKEKAREIRVSIIEMLVEAGSGHTAGALGMADIFAYLYFVGLKHDPKKPDWEERDRLVLSNGHICPVLYSAMAHSGYFPISELKTLRKFGSRLQGHPHRDFLPMIETSSGPLGCGLSQTVGMALADRIDKKERTFFCLMSDGELDEGNSWEGIMLAGKEKLGNITVIIDRNNIQISGFTDDVMPLEPLAKKWENFGWHVQVIDGNDFNAIDDAITKAKWVANKPSVIIAKTIPGKGVKEWENKFEWHGKPPTREEGEMAVKELKSNA